MTSQTGRDSLVERETQFKIQNFKMHDESSRFRDLCISPHGVVTSDPF
jgi:hypothetical protein